MQGTESIIFIDIDIYIYVFTGSVGISRVRSSVPRSVSLQVDEPGVEVGSKVS